MMLRFRVFVVLVACLAWACAPDPTAPDVVQDEPEVASAHKWAVLSAPKDQLLLESPAVVVASLSRVQLDATLQGTITRVHVAVGDSVEADAPLVEISMPAVLEAAAILGSSERQLATHRERRERVALLQSKGLMGGTELFELDRGIGALEAQRDLARATLASAGVSSERRNTALRRDGIVLRARIAGVVSRMDVAQGAVVDAGTPLLTLTGSAPSRIEVVDSRPLPTGVALEFVGADGTRFALRPEPVSSTVEPELGRTVTWYEPEDGLPRPDGLRGRVVVHVQGTDLLQVPRLSLRLKDGRAWVVAADGETATRLVPVDVVRSTGGFALIRAEGLASGDRVAVDPAEVLAVLDEQAEQP